METLTSQEAHARQQGVLSALSDALFLTVGFYSRGQFLSCARVIVATARKVSCVQKSRQEAVTNHAKSPH